MYAYEMLQRGQKYLIAYKSATSFTHKKGKDFTTKPKVRKYKEIIKMISWAINVHPRKQVEACNATLDIFFLRSTWNF